MKRAILIGLVLCLNVASAQASEWSTADKWRQGTYTALHIADWLQTREIARSGWRTEENVILGSKPNSNEVNWYFASTLVAHYLVADRLPPEYRKAFQYVTIGMQAGAVGHNYGVGIRVKF